MVGLNVADDLGGTTADLRELQAEVDKARATLTKALEDGDEKAQAEAHRALTQARDALDRAKAANLED